MLHPQHGKGPVMSRHSKSLETLKTLRISSSWCSCNSGYWDVVLKLWKFGVTSQVFWARELLHFDISLNKSTSFSETEIRDIRTRRPVRGDQAGHGTWDPDECKACLICFAFRWVPCLVETYHHMEFLLWIRSFWRYNVLKYLKDYGNDYGDYYTMDGDVPRSKTPMPRPDNADATTRGYEPHELGWRYAGSPWHGRLRGATRSVHVSGFGMLTIQWISMETTWNNS